jgi:hypothetical protein
MSLDVEHNNNNLIARTAGMARLGGFCWTHLYSYNEIFEPAGGGAGLWWV